jgi:rhodanese-related sulfurtransferase
MEKLPEYIANHPWLVGMAALAALLVLVYEIRVRRDSFAAISPQDLIRLQNQGALVLDIRKPEDHAAGHIAGSRQMDSHELVKAGDNLKKYKEKPVVVYCYSGSTGASAARVLNGQGFTQVFNLRGGISGWQSENLPIAREKGKA